jgi:hypothetical protein
VRTCSVQAEERIPLHVLVPPEGQTGLIIHGLQGNNSIGIRKGDLARPASLGQSLEQDPVEKAFFVLAGQTPFETAAVHPDVETLPGQVWHPALAGHAGFGLELSTV